MFKSNLNLHKHRDNLIFNYKYHYTKKKSNTSWISFLLQKRYTFFFCQKLFILLSSYPPLFFSFTILSHYTIVFTILLFIYFSLYLQVSPKFNETLRFPTKISKNMLFRQNFLFLCHFIFYLYIFYMLIAQFI